MNEFPNQHHSTHLLQVKSWHLAVLVLVLVVPWVVLVLRPEPLPVGPTPPALTNDLTASSDLRSRLIKHCKPGPWGELDYSRIVMEPPAEFAGAYAQSEPEVPRWVFPGQTRDQVSLFLQSAKLTSNQWNEIQARAEWSTGPNGTIVRPAREWVLGLTRESRSLIYDVLADSEENAAQYYALCYHAELMDEWLGNAGLQPATLQLIKSLLYVKERTLFLGDLNLAMSLVPDPAERLRLAKALYRQSALLVKLRVRPTSNIDALVSYWSRGGRTKDVKPLLESLPKLPNGFMIDINHLLPKFARAYLNTYPQPNVDSCHDCHWAALNFFNLDPLEKYANRQDAAAAYMSDYYAITGNPLLGDILVLVTPQGKALHSCVYVADDIVFTKNGLTSCAPWVLMELTDVLAFYAQQQPFRVVTYRLSKLG